MDPLVSLVIIGALASAVIGIVVGALKANRRAKSERLAPAVQATGGSTVSDDPVTQDDSIDEVKSREIIRELMLKAIELTQDDSIDGVKSRCISIGGSDGAEPRSAETYVREILVLLGRIQNEGGPGNLLNLGTSVVRRPSGGWYLDAEIQVMGNPGDEWLFSCLFTGADDDLLSDELRQFVRKAVSCDWDLSEPGSDMHLSVYKMLKIETGADLQSAAIFLLKTFGVVFGLRQGEEILAELSLADRQGVTAGISNSEWVNGMMLAPPSAPVESAGRREPIPAHVRREVWRRDQGRCVKCGSRERLEFDHIIPVSKEGSNTARNIELLCEKCNRSKGAKIE